LAAGACYNRHYPRPAADCSVARVAVYQASAVHEIRSSVSSSWTPPGGRSSKKPLVSTFAVRFPDRSGAVPSPVTTSFPRIRQAVSARPHRYHIPQPLNKLGL